MDNGWREWSKHVLKELERLNECYIAMDKDFDEKIDDLKRCVSEVKIEVARLKVKAGYWGAMGAAIPIIITLAIMAIRSQM